MLISSFYAVLNMWTVKATPESRNQSKTRIPAFDSPVGWIVQNKRYQ